MNDLSKYLANETTKTEKRMASVTQFLFLPLAEKRVLVAVGKAERAHRLLHRRAEIVNKQSEGGREARAHPQLFTGLCLVAAAA